ncbi:MAG: hypothetical protein B6D44_02065 [Ignavibacteriales bacterium UTCHB2]|jgi:hypothetical protein|nr:MAG: hypothetical protein B6D44_02065 [Ignavibacteriales bacterium UTCHB2]HQI41294.1 hypothetical protein [Ignavibacteriaceae bacterium]
MDYLNFSKHFNRVEQRLSVLVPYVLPMCSLSAGYAEKNKNRSSLDQVNLVTDDPDISSLLKSRAPPLQFSIFLKTVSIN